MSRNPLNIFVSHPSHFLTDTQPHGDGLIANGLLRGLAARGHRLHIACGLSDLREPFGGDVHFYPLATRSPHERDRQGLLYRMEYALRVRTLFRKLHRTERFDLIHQMNPVVGGLSLLLPGLGCPLILGPLWPLWENPKRSAQAGPGLGARVKDALLAAQFLRADGVLAPTPASAARLPNSMRRAGEAYDFPLAIDAQQFGPSAASPAQPTVLFLANLQERKGIFVLLEAFEQVARKLPRARLLIGGSGWDADEVRRRVAASVYRPRIEMLGNVARADVPATLGRCSVYCLPSFGEPYGMSALEAMAAGRPLVVTSTGGLGHLAQDGGALKVAPQDADALAAALIQLLADSALQVKMGSFNRRHAVEHHSWEHVLNRLEEIYGTLIGQPGHAGIDVSACAQEEAVL